jgi:hypothetical protein
VNRSGSDRRDDTIGRRKWQRSYPHRPVASVKQGSDQP